MAPAAGTPPSPLHADEPSHWLGGTSLLDLEDPKLRLRVRSLTQLCKGEREKALVIYGFVKRMPLVTPFKLRLRSARQVLDAGRGDSLDKATLLVAMLRAAGLPARIRYLRMRGEIMHGLTTRLRHPIRPLLEVWLQGRWVRTDTYIFDASYMAAARQRLKDEGNQWGYYINVAGAMLWDGREDAFVGSMPIEQDPMVVDDLGAWHDPLQFVQSNAYKSEHRPLARLLHLNLVSAQVRRGMRRLREDRPMASAVRDRRLS
ncbi:transglutaminase domain-containing protein [Ramlibacter sp. G-1-2-2]|uniref:Transglutaminase domain-containing protein n=1 Tax=Ramlibacter agri TaxID=2728837 RepID=A0A848HBE5_9BURK|nr:transglutaminase domain-containing protein [Ramlibacter agri]